MKCESKSDQMEHVSRPVRGRWILASRIARNGTSAVQFWGNQKSVDFLTWYLWYLCLKHPPPWGGGVSAKNKRRGTHSQEIKRRVALWLILLMPLMFATNVRLIRETCKFYMYEFYILGWGEAAVDPNRYLYWRFSLQRA